MAIDLKVAVRQEITQLRRSIAQKSSELSGLNDKLKKHERVYELLSDNRARRRAPRRRARKSRTVDWNSALKGLSSSFTIGDLAKKSGARGKPNPYLRQVVVRWLKEGKTKRIGRGKYRKA